MIVTRNNNIRVRSRHVMEERFHVEDIKSPIYHFLPQYQESIKNLKRNGLEIVGYAKKSPSNDKDENRLKLMQKMAENLQNHSLATRIYVSFPSSERDTTTGKSIIKKLSNANGDMQDMQIMTSVWYPSITTIKIAIAKFINSIVVF